MTRQLQQLSDPAYRSDFDFADRPSVEQFVRRIEVEPETKSAADFVNADAAEIPAAARALGGNRGEPPPKSRLRPFIDRRRPGRLSP